MLRVAIPGGVWPHESPAEDAPLRELALRPVGGEDEAFLLDTAEGTAPSTRASALLARCLVETDAENVARSLTVGDREALLLQLRRLTLGETFDCVVSCPLESCGEPMELALRVGDLLVPEYKDVRRAYELRLDAGDGRYVVSFRLPTAADLDRAAALALTNPTQAARHLLKRCVVSVTCNQIATSVETLPPTVCDAISSEMTQRDPQAEIELDLTCPTCGAAFSIVFDTAMFFLQELDQRAGRLMQEVHALASHYHWSERDILNMPRRRRTCYLELVADAARRVRAT